MYLKYLASWPFLNFYLFSKSVPFYLINHFNLISCEIILISCFGYNELLLLLFTGDL